jgi:hypothetical protein
MTACENCTEEFNAKVPQFNCSACWDIVQSELKNKNDITYKAKYHEAIDVIIFYCHPHTGPLGSRARKFMIDNQGDLKL